jgi:hypothetical protein
MSCKKCGADSAFASITGECLDCKPLPNSTSGGKIGNALPDPQPTLRDMWAMEIFQKINIGCGTEEYAKPTRLPILPWK